MPLFNASETRWPSSFTFPFTNVTMDLTPITGRDEDGTASQRRFTASTGPQFEKLNTSGILDHKDWAFAGEPAVSSDGKIYFVPDRFAPPLPVATATGTWHYLPVVLPPAGSFAIGR